MNDLFVPYIFSAGTHQQATLIESNNSGTVNKFSLDFELNCGESGRLNSAFCTLLVII